MSDLSSIDEAARRLGQPDVTAGELAQIAAAHPALRALVAQHPRSYPELRAWIAAAASAEPAPEVVAPAVVAPAVVAPVGDAATGGSPAGQVPAVRATPVAKGGARGWVPWAVAGVAVVVAAGSWVVPHPGTSAAAAPTSASSSAPGVAASAAPAASAGATPGSTAGTGGTAGSGGPSTFAAAEQTFATPQAAIAFLAQRLASGDAAGAATAFATTSAVDGYDFVVATDRLKAMTAYSWLPSTSPYYRTLDLGQRAWEIASQLRRMTWSVVDPKDDPTALIPVTDTPAAKDLAGRLDPAAMSRLTVVHVDEVGVGHPARTAVFPQLAAPYGADQYAEYAVLYGTANGPMSGGVSLLRYGDRWLILNLSSALLDTGNGNLTASSEEQYAATLAQ